MKIAVRLGWFLLLFRARFRCIIDRSWISVCGSEEVEFFGIFSHFIVYSFRLLGQNRLNQRIIKSHINISVGL